MIDFYFSVPYSREELKDLIETNLNHTNSSFTEDITAYMVTHHNPPKYIYSIERTKQGGFKLSVSVHGTDAEKEKARTDVKKMLEGIVSGTISVEEPKPMPAHQKFLFPRV